MMISIHLDILEMQMQGKKSEAEKFVESKEFKVRKAHRDCSMKSHCLMKGHFERAASSLLAFTKLDGLCSRTRGSNFRQY